MTTAIETLNPTEEVPPSPSLQELYERAEPPIAVYDIDPNLPDWGPDAKYGKLISYNSGTPVLWKNQWLIPIRVEYKDDEHYSVVLWRTWPPAAELQPDTRPGHEGKLAIKLGLLEREPGVTPKAGEGETWFMGQDPSVWTARLPEVEGGEPQERLFLSYTEVKEMWCDPVAKAKLDKAKMLDPAGSEANDLAEQSLFSEKQEPGMVRAIWWRNVVMSGTDPHNMVREYVSSWGNKNQFGVDMDDGTMLFVTRPQDTSLEGGLPEAGLGKLGLLRVKSMEEFRSLSYDPAKGPKNDPIKKARLVKGFGDDETWPGAKSGKHLGDGMVRFDGSHLATRFSVPATRLVRDQNGKRVHTIRLYLGTEVDVNVDTAQAVRQRITSQPWHIRLGAEPKRDELTYIAFEAGEVPEEAQIQLPPELAGTIGPFVQKIASYGDGQLRLVVQHRERGFDSPEVRAEAQAATAHAAGSLTLAELMNTLISDEFPLVPDFVGLRRTWRRTKVRRK